MLHINFYNLIELIYARSVLKKTKQEKLKCNKTVVFFTLRPISIALFQELFLAYQIASQGAKTMVYIDDGMFKHWDLIHSNDNSSLTYYGRKNIKNVLKLCYAKLIIWVHRHKNIDIIYLSKLKINRSLNDINLTESDYKCAESSVRRYFQTGYCDRKNQVHQNYFNKSLYNCKLSRAIARHICLNINPDSFIMSHGIYSLWGPAFEYVNTRKIRAYVYSAHAYKYQEIIISDVVHQVLSKDKSYQNYNKYYSLKDEDVNRVKNYFENRFSFKAVDTRIYYKEIDNYKEITVVRKKNSVKNFAIFPNIIWDGDVHHRDTIFNGMLEWLICTINEFKKSKNNLIIRFHPAESNLWRNAVKLQSIVEDKVKDLNNYKNIYLLSSDEKINTYNFISKNIDIGIVYDGMISMELVYLGKPVISCSDSRFTDSGFPYRPKTLNDYLDFIKYPNTILNDYDVSKEQRLNLMYKYANWYLYHSGYHFPIFDKNKYLKINYYDLYKNKFQLSKNKELKLTINKLI